MIILDTNVVSALMLDQPAVKIESWLDSQARTSVWTTTITVFEVRFGLAAMPIGRRKAMLLELFERLIGERLEQRVLVFDGPAAAEAAVLMASRQRTGKSRELRDTMIAGIALANNGTLATRNVRRFDDLSVPVIDPWQV